MTNKLMKTMLAASLVLAHAGAPAEDIDLFVKGEVPQSERPNVLIVMDNTANWSQAFDNEKSALVSLMANLPVDKFNVGLMMFTESGGDNGTPKGNYVRAAVRTMDVANKAKYGDLFASLDENNDKGDRANFGLAMAEAYRYFSGSEAYAGHNKVKRDYTGNSVPSYLKSNAVYALAGNALTSSASTTYVSPVTGGCQQNFIIFISNGASDTGENAGDEVNKLLAAAGGSTTQIPLSPSGRQEIVSDEWARFMANTDIKSTVDGVQRVSTYTLDVNPKKTGQGPDNTALLRSMASQGKGSYFAVSSADGGKQIADALKAIFSEIISVDTAFASASLPVSVNTQGTYLNQVFIGMFRPQPEPRWYGNLKQYQFRADVNANGDIVGLKLADKNNAPAINAQNGFITPCANSFWSTADTYWPNGYLGSCVSADLRSNAPDGEIVEKGGAGQRLRALAIASRSVKTCAGTCDSLTDFLIGNTAITKTLLGDAAMTDTTRADLINWVRGQNVSNEMSKGTTVMRPSAHGDVVHSRPLAVDYGGTTGVVVYYGGNDGMLRAINGNKLDTAGNELWSFVAPEHYAKLKRLSNNTPNIAFPAAPDGTEPKDYFFDGSIGVHRSDSTVWIYPTMRRGGRMVYAFDVSTPGSPTIKWKNGCPNAGDDTGCSDGFSQIGQTWSEPKVVKVVGYPSAAEAEKSPLIIMGGGYDPCEDEDAAPNTACTSTKGNRVFVMDAATGTVLKTLTTDRSVPADITPVDSDFDGYVDVAYVVDTAANIYRIDIGSTAPSGWTISKIASLGCTTSATCARKFLQAPEVVVRSGFNAVLVGSGNRERPLKSNKAVDVDNAFFMVKDFRETVPAVITTDDLVALDPETPQTTAQKTALSDSTNKGWYLALGSGYHDGEQVVTSSVVLAGVAYFSTHQPEPPTDEEKKSCGSNLGMARGYAVDFLDGSSPDDSNGGLYNEFTGGGLPPSPVSGIVTLPLTDVDGSPLLDANGNPVTASVPFVIGGGGAAGGPGAANKCGISGIDACKVDVTAKGVRGRVFWYIDSEQ